MKKFFALIIIILIFLSVYAVLKREDVINTEGVLVKNFKRSIEYGYIKQRV